MNRRHVWGARKSDFRVDTFRGSGKGGQHRNKTDSAVRITHKESGLSAESQSERSQAVNKKIAFRKLVQKLVDHYVRGPEKRRYEAGKQVIRSYHEPEDRVTDHVTGHKFSYKQTVGKGDLSMIIEAKLRAVR